MAPSKPTIIFVPGGWHSPEGFSTVRASLESHGYRTIGVSLPSVGAEPPLKTWDPDVEAIRSAIQKVADDEGGDVVLAMHSYGAMPSSEAAKDFAKTERERKGMKGGIVRLVYICAALMDVGKALFDPSVKTEGVGGKAKIDGDRITAVNPAHYFYNDLPPETADYWSSKLKHHSLPTFTCPVTYTAWRHIPTTYLLCEADNALPLPTQEAMVEAARAAGVEIMVERCKAGHSPFLSVPEVVVGLVRRAAGEEGVGVRGLGTYYRE